MGKSNRTAALERKIELLLGEREQKMEEIEAAERLIAQLPELRGRLGEIDKLVTACEDVIRSDQPAWTRDHIKPSRPFVHKIPVRIGNCSRTALDVLRLAGEPMRVRDIAIAVLAREGITDPDKGNIIKVSNTVGNALKKKLKDGYVATDGAWPGSWWAVPASE
ncbi:hypothetical protein FHT00_001577 [Sphingomonas insulae]|uniref:Uncharacterized protein n=1 Tax=Sphingomonas insulae TaxID=424800 RepID=A0ABP3T197_9SPHN|nr:hypothetical protein [Sphingomonas insulae]NIJ29630.1 hypothetical protein [Sphingomonas insulae]